jgi:hypothetical protein
MAMVMGKLFCMRCGSACSSNIIIHRAFQQDIVQVPNVRTRPSPG